MVSAQLLSILNFQKQRRVLQETVTAALLLVRIACAEVGRAQSEPGALWKQGQRAFMTKVEVVKHREVCTDEQRQISLTSAVLTAAVNW